MDNSNAIVAQSIGAWANVEQVVVNGKNFQYSESRGSTLLISLLNGTVDVRDSLGLTYEVPCLNPQLLGAIYGKAIVLMDVCRKLPRLAKKQKCEVYQPNTPGRIGQSDSDDEQVPYAKIDPSFTDAEMVLVQHYFDKLQESYQVARAVGFVNCCGKDFFKSLCEFTDFCCPRKNHKYLQNTSKGESQPGAFYIMWSLPQRELSGSHSELVVVDVKERYADGVAYNTENFISEVVTEIKREDSADSRDEKSPTRDENSPTRDENKPTSAESQHNEQMIGLWRDDQQAMLGLKFYTDSVVPKVLLLDNNVLHMFYLEQLKLNIPSDVATLVKQIIAFTTFVQCYVPQLSFSQ